VQTVRNVSESRLAPPRRLEQYGLYGFGLSEAYSHMYGPHSQHEPAHA